MFSREMLRVYDLFTGLSDESQDAVCAVLNAGGIVRSYRRGEMIAEPGRLATHIYFVLSGNVKSYSVTSEGKEIHVTHHSRNSTRMFFFLNCFSGSVIHSYYSAVSPCTLLIVPKAAMVLMMDTIPEFRWNMINMLCTSVNNSFSHFFSMDFKKARQRVGAYLESRCRDSNVLQGQHTVELPFKQEDLAGYLSLTRPVLSKELHALQDEGYIQLTGSRNILIPDVALLRELRGD